MNPVPRPPKKRANLTATTRDVRKNELLRESRRQRDTHLTVTIGDVINERSSR